MKNQKKNKKKIAAVVAVSQLFKEPLEKNLGVPWMSKRKVGWIKT